MISSGFTAGSEMSIRPKPVSSGMGVKLSLPCPAAAIAHPTVSSIANPHRFGTVLLPFLSIRRRDTSAGCFRRLGSAGRWLSGPQPDRRRVVPPAINPIIAEIHYGAAVFKLVFGKRCRSALNPQHGVLGRAIGKEIQAWIDG